MRRIRIIKSLFIFIFFLSSYKTTIAQTIPDSVVGRTTPLIHRLEIEARPGQILPTNRFIRGHNRLERSIKQSLSVHLKYGFQFHPDSRTGQIYRGAYQGIGFGQYTFDSPDEIGDPMVFYLYQGATIAKITPRLSFDYEWNFGLSSKWKPYDYHQNPHNGMVGSKVNAYMNVNFYFRQLLTRHFDLICGFGLTHFSNGNTKFPNAGLNAADIKAGITYNINRQERCLVKNLPGSMSLIKEFPRHISYDVVLFGSWRRKGVLFNEEPMASPDKYTVLGFNINPMYNLGYKVRLGASIDGVYDSSANVYTEDYIYSDVNPGYTFYKPAIKRQLALGISARAEYVMPYFDVGIGIGTNVIHGGGDLKGLYQILALKIKMNRYSFIHIGYNLQNFDTPNYLMLGLGVRINNRSPRH